ncbi:MAG: hypothetical protein K1X75_16395 [Leptospirales bacterium]|nr:hypothetical protein [Leptospirales bacterium]
MSSVYRGRLAPSPTGDLHLGHARTFWSAYSRARERKGLLVYREEDLDVARCRPQYAQSALDDLRALGIVWQEGPDIGGMLGPYKQSERQHFYQAAWRALKATGLIYPSAHSRRDVQRALSAPQGEEESEAIFPPTLRPPPGEGQDAASPGDCNWRFRVPDGESIAFLDRRLGLQRFTAGVDFGDFVVWRKDGFPSYELAVVVDDAAMKISEVVRGEDLLLSTARQLLLYRALQHAPPEFYHCALVLDENGQRLAKRSAAYSLRALLAECGGGEALRRRYSFP